LNSLPVKSIKVLGDEKGCLLDTLEMKVVEGLVCKNNANRESPAEGKRVINTIIPLVDFHVGNVNSPPKHGN